MSPRSSADTAVPPAGQGRGRAPLGTEDYTRTRHGHFLGAQSTLPAAAPLQPIRPREWPGMKNVISKLVPHTPCPERDRDLVMSSNYIEQLNEKKNLEN